MGYLKDVKSGNMFSGIKKGWLILEVLQDETPQVEISSRELDVLKNKKVMDDIGTGMKQSQNGEIESKITISLHP